MNNLVNVPKNGSLNHTKSNLNFPILSHWFDDIFNKQFPIVFSSSFNSELSLPENVAIDKIEAPYLF